MSLTTDAKKRKAAPVWGGLLRYFPKACMAVAALSLKANEQHGHDVMHWDRDKSDDHEDSCVRHMMEAGTIDTDNVRHVVKAAWRALAAAEIELEKAEAEKHKEVHVSPPHEVALSFYRSAAFLSGLDYPDQRTPSGLPPAALDEHDDYPPA